MRKSSRLLLASTLIGSVSAPAIVHMSAYANTLTRLIPDLYAGLDVVSRELVGFIPSVARDASAERAAVNQSVVYHIAPERGLFDVTPAMAVPEPADVAMGYGTITITKSKGVEFGWTGEEQKGLNNGGPGYLSVMADNFAQGLRTLTNAVELDLAIEAALNASRFTGSPTVTPFASDVGAAAQVRKILDDNGAPPSNRSLIINTAAGAALRTLQQLTKANEAGTTMTLRQGELLDLSGLSIKESAQIQNTVAGTAAATATTSGAALAIGTTVIPLTAGGTGTIPTGSVFTIAGDTNKYHVVSGDTDVSNGGNVTIAEPGLRVAVPAVATAITMVALGAANIAFTRNALLLAARAPALPVEGDLAMDRRLITDPRSGLVFEVAIYPGYRKIRAEVTLAWGVKATKRAHIAGLFG